jgi:hypothetical protein
MQITTIGLDIAKNVFQIHGIDATEKVVVRKQLRRAETVWPTVYAATQCSERARDKRSEALFPPATKTD